MSSSTATASSTTDFTQCPVCDKTITRKGDFPRHMKLHLPSEERSKFMYRCPFEGCSFENLQKSNLNTHVRVHNGQKTKKCPDCDFMTCDPGSLTRHRKRFHKYVPKPRKSSAGGRQPTTKHSARLVPYSRGCTSSDGYSSSTLPSVSPGSDRHLGLPISDPSSSSSSASSPFCDRHQLFPADPSGTSSSWVDELASHGWDAFTASTQPIPTRVAARPPTPTVLRSPSPRSASPAINTTVLEDFIPSEYWEALCVALIGHGFGSNTCAAVPSSDTHLPAASTHQEYIYERQIPDYPDPEQTFPLHTYSPSQTSWSLREYITGVPVEATPSTASWDDIYVPPPTETDYFSVPASSPTSFDDITTPASAPTTQGLGFLTVYNV